MNKRTWIITGAIAGALVVVGLGIFLYQSLSANSYRPNEGEKAEKNKETVSVTITADKTTAVAGDVVTYKISVKSLVDDKNYSSNRSTLSVDGTLADGTRNGKDISFSMKSPSYNQTNEISVPVLLVDKIDEDYETRINRRYRPDGDDKKDDKSSTTTLTSVVSVGSSRIGRGGTEAKCTITINPKTAAVGSITKLYKVTNPSALLDRATIGTPTDVTTQKEIAVSNDNILEGTVAFSNKSNSELKVKVPQNCVSPVIIESNGFRSTLPKERDCSKTMSEITFAANETKTFPVVIAFGDYKKYTDVAATAERAFDANNVYWFNFDKTGKKKIVAKLGTMSADVTGISYSTTIQTVSTTLKFTEKIVYSNATKLLQTSVAISTAIEAAATSVNLKPRNVLKGEVEFKNVTAAPVKVNFANNCQNPKIVFSGKTYALPSDNNCGTTVSELTLQPNEIKKYPIHAIFAYKADHFSKIVYNASTHQLNPASIYWVDPENGKITLKWGNITGGSFVVAVDN